MNRIGQHVGIAALSALILAPTTVPPAQVYALLERRAPVEAGSLLLPCRGSCGRDLPDARFSPAPGNTKRRGRSVWCRDCASDHAKAKRAACPEIRERNRRSKKAADARMSAAGWSDAYRARCLESYYARKVERAATWPSPGPCVVCGKPRPAVVGTPRKVCGAPACKSEINRRSMRAVRARKSGEVAT